jgi:hypothetical protein
MAKAPRDREREPELLPLDARPWTPPRRTARRVVPPPPPEPDADADADAASRLFDPALYHYDPVSRCGLPYDGMRPCSCGCTQFMLVMRGEDTRCHVICQACYGDVRFRLARPDDLVYGHLDKRTKVVTYNRPLGELIAMRSRIKAP